MNWKDEIKKDFGEGGYSKEELSDFMRGTNKFLKDLEEFRKEIAKSSNKGPIPTYVVEVLNKNLDEMKEITKPLPQNYNKGSTNSSMRSYKTGRPIKGHPHHGKYGIKE